MKGGIKAELEGINNLVLRIDEVFGQLAAAEHTEGTRLAQDTFNGLNELDRSLLQLGQASPISVQKMTQLWDFAQ